jgi:hypothetical protein
MSNQAQIVAQANALLAAKNELGARWWLYTASLSAFELVVGEPGGGGNLVLVMPSCTFLSGPVAWKPQRLSVSVREPSAEADATAYELRDDAAGFIARSSVFMFKEGWDLLENGSVMFPHGWRGSSDA